MNQQQQLENMPKSQDRMGKSLTHQPLTENVNLNSQRVPISTLSSLSVGTTPQTTIALVALVSSLQFDGSSITNIKMVNLQQKALLSYLATTEKFNSSITIRKLFDTYTALHNKKRLP